MAPYVAAGRTARTVTKSLRQQLGHIATVRYVHVTWHITMMCCCLALLHICMLSPE